MQHNLFPHPNPRLRSAYPLLVVMQADIAEGDERVVAPSTPAVGERPSRMRPLIRHEGKAFVVMMRLLGLIPTRLLRQPVGSIASCRAELTRALD